MPIDIREFRLDDYDNAIALWQRTPNVGLSDADGRAEIGAFLERNPGMSFVAVDGNSLVGTILCGHDGRRGLIHHLVSAPEVRRQGLGRRLLDAGLEGFRLAGIRKVHFLVFHANQAGIAFWTAVGAQRRSDVNLYSIRVPDKEASKPGRMP